MLFTRLFTSLQQQWPKMNRADASTWNLIQLLHFVIATLEFDGFIGENQVFL